MRIEDIAYVAGFFDGEGHIRIQKHSTRCRTLMLQCQAVQATKFPLDLFKEMFGGTVTSRLMKYRDTYRPLYTWQVSSLGAEKFLEIIYPYLRVKKDEADIALEFRATFRPQHVKGGHKRMSDEVIDFREERSRRLKDIRHEKREHSLATIKSQA